MNQVNYIGGISKRVFIEQYFGAEKRLRTNEKILAKIASGLIAPDTTLCWCIGCQQRPVPVLCVCVHSIIENVFI